MLHETPSPALSRWLRTLTGRALLLFVASTLAGLFFATQFYFVMKAWGTPVSWEWVLQARLWAWYQWGALFLLVMWLSRRFAFRRGRWRGPLAVHLPASVAIAAIQIAVNTWTHLTFVADPERGLTYRGYLEGLMQFAFHRNLLIYWIMLGGEHAYRISRELQAQRMRATELKSRLAEARLQALKMQLHPHFLFNTLNAVTALTRTSPARADRVVNDLSQLLRMALDDVDTQKVPFAREVQFLELYLDIQRVRFGDRLRVSMDLDPKVLTALSPNLLLQPIVENSVRHAVAARYAGGHIHVKAEPHGDRWTLLVRDDGPGIREPAGPAVGTGLGLSSTRERLAELYPDSHEFHIGNAPGGGVEVRITLPLERAPEPAEPAEAAPSPAPRKEEAA